MILRALCVSTRSRVRVLCIAFFCGGWLEVGAIATEMPGLLVVQGQSIEMEQRRQLNEDRELYQNRRPPPAGIENMPSETTNEVESTGPCEAYEGLHIANPIRLSKQVLRKVEEKLAQACLNVRDVEDILATLNEYYIRLGLITTRAIRLQSQDSQLSLLVVPGFIERIQRLDERDDTSLAMVFPRYEGRLLDMWELEEGLEKINALGSNSARISIQPGERLGGSTVAFENKLSKPQRFHMGLDNLGGKNTGVWQWTLGGSFDNVLGVQDGLFVSAKASKRESVNGAYSTSYSLQYQIPYGLNQYSLSWQGGRYKYPVPLASGMVPDYAGQWDSLGLGWERLLMRNQLSRISMEFRLRTGKSRNYFAKQILELQSPRLSSLELELRTRTYLPEGGAFNGSLTWLKGIGAFGGVRDISTIDPQYPSSRYSAFKAAIGLDGSFLSINFNSQFEVQSSGNALYSASQFSIGNPSTVRGFSKNSATGSSGALIRNTFSRPVMVNLPMTKFVWTPYFAWDVGRVAARNSLSGRSLTLEGLSYGMKFSGNYFFVDVIYSRPVRKISIPQEKGQIYIRSTIPF